MSKYERPMSKLSWLLLRATAWAFLFAAVMGLFAAGTYFAGAAVKNITEMFK